MYPAVDRSLAFPYIHGRSSVGFFSGTSFGDFDSETDPSAFCAQPDNGAEADIQPRSVLVNI